MNVSALYVCWIHSFIHSFFHPHVKWYIHNCSQNTTITFMWCSVVMCIQYKYMRVSSIDCDCVCVRAYVLECEGPSFHFIGIPISVSRSMKSRCTQKFITVKSLMSFESNKLSSNHVDCETVHFL